MLKIYKIIFLSALPFCCLAQFSIEGPSDGNRQAQGLKYSADKGIEYTDKSASLGAGDFTIQGATDGNSNFKIQGASDANTDFQIQGPTHGGARTYLQDPYDANQGGANLEGSGRALQYQDPSGLRVNWRSYGHDRQARPQAQPAQYAAETAAPRPAIQQPRRRQPAARQQPQQLQQPAAPRAPPNYTPFNNAPSQIKQLLEYQAQIPYLNAIPEPFRYDAETAAQVHARQFQEEYPKQVQQAARERLQAQAPAPQPAEGQQQYQTRGQYRAKYRADSRQKRQAPGGYQHQQQQQQQQQQQPDLSQYRRISQPAAEPQPRYSSNVPPQIASILKYQAQIPYDIVANQISYRLDKPYVPQPVQQPQQQPQYAQQPQPQQQYAQQPQQPARPEYTPQYAQGQSQGQFQAQGQHYGQTQAQGQYYGQGSTRPVTEQQY